MSKNIAVPSLKDEEKESLSMPYEVVISTRKEIEELVCMYGRKTQPVRRVLVIRGA